MLFSIRAGGADEGKDIVVEETRIGVGGKTKIRWLVCCKHYAYSGDSVGVDDEKSVLERARANGCKGFLGFYSTLPSSALQKRLEGLKSDIETQTFDKEKIEARLCGSVEGMSLASRYFPVSMSKWFRENPRPATVFEDNQGLKCKLCGADLSVRKGDKGILVLWENEITTSTGKKTVCITEAYCCCQGRCDATQKALYRKTHPKHIDLWRELADLHIPTFYIQWIMSLFNRIFEGTEISQDAFTSIKTILLEIYPYVARELTTKEKERVSFVMDFPIF